MLLLLLAVVGPGQRIVITGLLQGDAEPEQGHVMSWDENIDLRQAQRAMTRSQSQGRDMA